MTDIHALIHTFLQQNQRFVPPHAGDDSLTKAGIVPFIRASEELRGQQAEPALSGASWGAQERAPEALYFYLMKPVARHAGLDAPPFQLCKGTRQFRTDTGWHDMRDGATGAQKEPLIATALREGIEELGLELKNILNIADMGSYSFASATTGKPKQMRLYAIEVASPNRFLPSADVAAATEARKWMTAAEFDKIGRADHRIILNDIAKKLMKKETGVAHPPH